VSRNASSAVGSWNRCRESQHRWRLFQVVRSG
jgi:hypothetical protein